MPKQRITKEMVIDAAFEIARDSGMEKVMVKSIAEKLNCSVQPIYSYCENMESLRRQVAWCAKKFVQEYIRTHIDRDDLFGSTGRAYVKMAKEEPYLFKIFVFQERENITSLEELYVSETNPDIAEVIAEQMNIPIEEARQLHLHMLIYTIGIGTICSVTSSKLSEKEIFYQQEQAYQAFLKQVLKEK